MITSYLFLLQFILIEERPTLILQLISTEILNNLRSKPSHFNYSRLYFNRKSTFSNSDNKPSFYAYSLGLTLIQTANYLQTLQFILSWHPRFDQQLGF